MAEKEQIPVQTRKGFAVIPERLKAIDRGEYFAVLATSNKGRPYTSLVTYALTPDLKQLIFATPRNTRKYANLIHSENIAILIDNRSQKHKKLLETEAITIIGVARPVRRGKTWDEFAGIFLAKHPDLTEFINSPSTALIVVNINQCVHVGRFQTVSTLDYQ